MSSFDTALLLFAIVCGLASVAVISYLLAQHREDHQRIGRLEVKMAELDRGARHDKAHRDVLNLAEEFSFQQALLKDDLKIIEARLEYMDRVAQKNMNPNGGKS